MYALKAALKSKTGLVDFELASLVSDTSDPDKTVNTLTVKGYAKGGNNLETFTGELPEDTEGSQLRNLFLARAGEIKGTAHRVEVNIYVNKGTADGIVYYVSPEGEKLKKNFTM